MPMKIGYADEQHLHLQVDALTAHGCTVIYQDESLSGISMERQGLTQALAALETGDTLVVWKLDRLGRSLGFLCALIDRLGQQSAGFISLTDGIDTTTSSGKLVFHIMGALAEFERDLIRERTKAGMKAAQKRGKHVGRPKALSPGQVQHLWELMAQGKTRGEMAALFGVSVNTIGRALKKAPASCLDTTMAQAKPMSAENVFQP